MKEKKLNSISLLPIRQFVERHGWFDGLTVTNIDEKHFRLSMIRLDDGTVPLSTIILDHIRLTWKYIKVN